MARTTIDIDAPLLKDLKRLQRREGKTLGRLISELLVQALASRSEPRSAAPVFQWRAQAMGARVDLADTDALYRVLDTAD